MSFGDVRGNWNVYKDILRIINASTVGTIDLDPKTGPYLPFPKQPAKWPAWTGGIINDLNAKQVFTDTDTALKNAVDLFAGQHALAAKVVVHPPDAATVTQIVADLRQINVVVKKGQMSKATIAIVGAFAKGIEDTLAA